jgi:hypothetical protein
MCHDDPALGGPDARPPAPVDLAPAPRRLPETPEDLEAIERRPRRGEVDTGASFGDRRAEVNEGGRTMRRAPAGRRERSPRVSVGTCRLRTRRTAR